MKDVEVTNPGFNFVICDLEQIYSEMLAGHGIYWSCHSSTFADLLVEHVDGLIKVTTPKVRVCFSTAVKDIDHETNDPKAFFKSLIKVVGPVRQAMRLKCQSKTQDTSFDKQSQIKSIPIELLTLINFVQDGIDASVDGFSKESLAISQKNLYNFRINRDKKQISLHKRHDQIKETPFPMYIAIKIYHETRSKTLTNWLYFCAGISISYSRLLDFLKDISEKMIERYYHNGEIFLPRNLRRNLLTIVAKDNIDQNARSTTATKHCHGTSFSIFQFPTLEQRGEPIKDPCNNEDGDCELGVSTKKNSKKRRKLTHSLLRLIW